MHTSFPVSRLPPSPIHNLYIIEKKISFVLQISPFEIQMRLKKKLSMDSVRMHGAAAAAAAT